MHAHLLRINKHYTILASQIMLNYIMGMLSDEMGGMGHAGRMAHVYCCYSYKIMNSSIPYFQDEK